MHKKASDVLAAGLVGAFRSDTTLLLLLANSQLDLGAPDESQKCLDRRVEPFRNDEERQFNLCQARILALRGQLAEAEPIFHDVIKGRRSEESRYYFAEALLRAGRTEEATAILDDIVKRYRVGNAVYRRLERPWFLSSQRLRKYGLDHMPGTGSHK